MICLCEVASFSLNQETYPLFYFKGLENELPSDLYGKLDPLLGYTFNRKAKMTSFERKHHPTLEKNWESKDGYIYFHHPARDVGVRAVKILIYGGSATDSNIFHGNWPYFLHEDLKEKDIPHTIINGAVSGYSSNQEMIKLQRDISSFRDIAMVIAFNGINDTLANEDITKNHPWVHPYQELLYKKLSGSPSRFVSSTFLPNLRSRISKMFTSMKIEISYGPVFTDYEDRYLFNIKTMKAICDLKGVRFLHVLQPIAWEEKQREKNFTDNRELSFLSNIRPFYTKVRQNLPEYSFDLDSLLRDGGEIGFVDFVHLSEVGNKKIAKELNIEIKKRLELKRYDN